MSGDSTEPEENRKREDSISRLGRFPWSRVMVWAVIGVPFVLASNAASWWVVYGRTPEERPWSWGREWFRAAFVSFAVFCFLAWLGRRRLRRKA